MADTIIPQYGTLSKWGEISGMGRTRTYEEAGKGNLRLIKVGGRTLVDIPHGLAWMRTLPSAQIRPPLSTGALKPSSDPHVTP
jgi:hypothetical protein